MMVDNIMVRPEDLERGHRYKNAAAGFKKVMGTFKSFPRIVKVLEHIQHQ